MLSQYKVMLSQYYDYKNQRRKHYDYKCKETLLYSMLSHKLRLKLWMVVHSITNYAYPSQ